MTAPNARAADREAYEAEIAQLRGIVTDLAALDCPLNCHGDDEDCRLCDAPCPWDRDGVRRNDLSWHEPSCPWRRARELVQHK